MSDWWNKEFQYLLDGKILSKDELAYLFGQVKSIIDKERLALQAQHKKLREALEEIKADSYPGLAVKESTLLNRVYTTAKQALQKGGEK